MAKTFQKDGKWIDQPRPTKVEICGTCNRKYIKTREGQISCLSCAARIGEKASR